MIARLETGSGDAIFQLLDVIPSQNIPQAGPAFRFTVASWSMYPTIQKGDVLTMETPGQISVGDIIVFVLAGALVCHRVISGEADGTIRTRGDASSGEDLPLQPGDVIGRVTAIRRGSRSFAPAGAPAEATVADRARRRVALLWTSAREGLTHLAVTILTRLTRVHAIRAFGRRLLARHVRYYLGVRVPLQLMQAYRFEPLDEAALGRSSGTGRLTNGGDAGDVVIQARLGLHHLGTFHPSSGQTRVRRAAAAFGLEERFQDISRKLAEDHS